ncbi:glycosyltransferase family 4 protein [Nibrella saemangeumensis]
MYSPLPVDPREMSYVNWRKDAALAVTDYIFSLSGFATHSLVENGIQPYRIYELNLGVNLELFRPAVPRKSRFTALYVGTIHYLKGIDKLLAAWQTLKLPDAELIIVGPVGDAGSLLKQYSGSFTYLPFLHHDELVKYYQHADVFVFPSYLDSWGQVVLEAMACGTPVIVTENTGAKDAVAKGGGFVVPPGDQQALQEKIMYLYQNRAEVERLGLEARRVAEQYTWENYYAQVQGALEDIARRENISL